MLLGLNGDVDESSFRRNICIRARKLKAIAEKLDDRVPSLCVFDVVSEGRRYPILPSAASLSGMSRGHDAETPMDCSALE